MKYKVGDRVKIQSLERYNKYKNRYGDINYGCETEILFTSEMSSFCGQVVTITRVRYIGCVRFYHLAEDKGDHLWVDGMFEGLVEEETAHNKWTGLKVELELSKTVIGVSNVESLHGERFMSGLVKAIIPPEGCQFKDENGNIINASKIVLEKKKKEYPKTYEECCYVTGFENTEMVFEDDYRDINPPKEQWKRLELINQLNKLLICRDAYWKIAGEEMGLGKPWAPDWEDYEQKKFVFVVEGNTLIKKEYSIQSCILSFPTTEMRNAFKENFKELIEQCKELL